MARLIFICPYISGNSTRKSNHVNYIATREGVEMLAAKELNCSNVGDEEGVFEELQSEYLSFEEDVDPDNSEKRSILLITLQSVRAFRSLERTACFQ